MAKMGRPKKVINQSQFEAMCQIQATQEEITLVLNVSDKTLMHGANVRMVRLFPTFSAKREVQERLAYDENSGSWPIDLQQWQYFLASNFLDRLIKLKWKSIQLFKAILLKV